MSIYSFGVTGFFYKGTGWFHLHAVEENTTNVIAEKSHFMIHFQKEDIPTKHSKQKNKSSHEVDSKQEKGNKLYNMKCKSWLKFILF